jgi:hypothetical protein
MRVDFAIFGERGGAHELLSTSLREDAIALKIRGKTDRPPFAPPGHVLQPYTTSFAEGDHYVFTKTFPHEKAARGGMVITTALIMDLEEAVNIQNINKVLDLLPSDVLTAAPDAVEVQDEFNADIALDLQRSLAESLVVPGNKKPVVWLGPSFQDQLTSLWLAMWPETRRNFSHRLAFDPQDVNGDQLTIITVPIALESRWSDFVIVQQIAPSQRTLSGAAVMGIEEGQPVRELKNLLGIPIPVLREIIPLANISQTIGNPQPQLDELRSSLHTVGRLCASPLSGISVKETLVGRTVEAIARESDSIQIRAFRNLDLRPFTSGFELSTALRLWTVENGMSLNDPLFLTTSFDEKGPIALLFREGLAEALGKGESKEAVTTVSRWKELVPSLCRPLLTLASKVKLSDVALANLKWGLQESAATEVLRDWDETSYPLTAITILAESFPLKIAMNRLALVNMEAGDTRLRQFLDRVDSRKAFDYALDGGATLQILAAACILRQPQLLESTELSVPLLHALSIAITAGLEDSELSTAFVQSVLTCLGAYVVSENFEDVLWRLILNRIGSLLNIENRTAYWERIPNSLRQSFLDMTAADWIESVSDVSEVTVPERPLEQAILDRLRAHAVKLSLIPALSRILTSLDESIFTNALLNRSRAVHLDRLLAETLGDIIVAKNWRDVADCVFHTVGNDPDLRPVLSRCVDLLGRLQRLRAQWLILGRQTQPTTTELWGSLEELAVELYSWGPGEHNVWERAGGDPSLVKAAASGSEAWHHVLTYAKNGGGGDVSLKSLTKAMSREFGANDVLQKISEYARGR